MAEVDIVNWAFSIIGEAPITSGEWALGASGTLPRTQKAYALYAMIRDGTLRSYYWNCCMKYAEIIQDTVSPIHTFSTQYSLPADFLRMEFIHPRDEEIRYKIVGQKLYCDYSSGPDTFSAGTYYPLGKYISYNSITYKCLQAHTGTSDHLPDEVASEYWDSQDGDYSVLDMSYIYQNTDTTTWDPLLAEIVATRLAIQLCITLSADKEIWARLTEYYDRQLKPKAQVVDAQDDTPDDILTQSWLDEMN